MSGKILRQEVALTEDGRRMHIDFFRMLVKAIDGSTTTMTSGVSAADFTALQTRVTTLETNYSALAARVDRLEKGGYQS